MDGSAVISRAEGNERDHQVAPRSSSAPRVQVWDRGVTAGVTVSVWKSMRS
jgi:hypothetical protein